MLCLQKFERMLLLSAGEGVDLLQAHTVDYNPLIESQLALRN